MHQGRIIDDAELKAAREAERAVATETGLTKKDVVKTLETLVELAYAQAIVGFTLPGLGKLKIVQRKARTGNNPATKAAIKIPAKKVLKFTVAKAAKDAIVGPKK